jgi:cell division transport system permease protein
MMLRVVFHLFHRSFRSLLENAYLNSVAVGVIGASTLLLGVYLTVQFNLNRIVDTWDRDVHVSAYFHPDVPDQRRFALRDQLADHTEVTKVRYVSQEEAREWMRTQMPGMEAILDELGSGSLPASLEISMAPSTTNAESVATFARSLSVTDFSDIDYGQEWMERFDSFLSLLKLLGAIMGALILVAALFLVMNTVHLIVYNRKEELEIQKLVGATNFFILGPFVAEGMIQGLIGSSLAIGALFAVHEILVARLKDILELAANANLVFLPWTYLSALVVAATLTGTVAAWVAVQRFLLKTA